MINRMMLQLLRSRKRFYRLARNYLRMKYASGAFLVMLVLFLLPVYTGSSVFKINPAAHDTRDKYSDNTALKLQKRAAKNPVPSGKQKTKTSAKKADNGDDENDLDLLGNKNELMLDVKSAFRPWLQNECKPIRRLLSRRELMIKRIVQTVEKIAKSTDFNIEEKKYQIQTFNIFAKELNETESGVLESLEWLDAVLKGDYKNLASLQEKSKDRLQALRDAALVEEQEYSIIVQAQRGLYSEELQACVEIPDERYWVCDNSLEFFTTDIYISTSVEMEGLEKVNKSHISGVMDQLLAEVAKAADNLEESLNENLFNFALKDKKANGDDVETVIKLRSGEVDSNAKKSEGRLAGGQEEEEGGGMLGREVLEEEGVIKLVDSRDNQFVMSKGRDTTVPHEDHHLIEDIIYLVLTSFVFAAACQWLTLPTMFGYVITGVILGPSCLNVLQSLVQLETLGEFGVFFILFAVGLEFSPTKLKKVFKIATLGTLLMTCLFVLCGVLIGLLVGVTVSESVFVAACLSLSSTPLVVKFLSPTSANTGDSPSNADYGSVLLGILIMQDVLLGILIAILPNMASASKHHGSSTDSPDSFLDLYGWVALRLVAAMSIVGVTVVIVSRFVIGQAYTYIIRQGSREITVIFSVAVVFVALQFTELMGISMELGCFLAGVTISSQGHKLTQEVENLIQPIKDFLASIFFASIGLHVFPTFLAYQLTFLTTLTLAVVGGKYLISVAVLAVLSIRHPPSTQHIKWLVSAGLSQVSEFSFVLGSRARRLGLISREVYLLILSITTLSLLFAPVLWKATLWRLRIRMATKSQPQSVVISELLHESPPATSPVDGAATFSFDEEAPTLRRIAPIP